MPASWFAMHLLYLIEMKIIAVIALIITSICVRAQNVQFIKSVLSEQGPAGVMLTPNLKLENKGATTEEIKIKRVGINLPTNWYTCFCYLECLPASVDTLHFFMSPGEVVDIGIGFGTDSIEGVGKVKVELFQVGALQRDTLEFTGSTITSGLKENNSYSYEVYPNPFVETLNLRTVQKIKSLAIGDLAGKIFSTYKVNGNFISIPAGNLIPGMYFLYITDEQNSTVRVRVIKH